MRPLLWLGLELEAARHLPTQRSPRERRRFKAFYHRALRIVLQPLLALP
jgi:hypothetical protein